MGGGRHDLPPLLEHNSPPHLHASFHHHHMPMSGPHAEVCRVLAFRCVSSSSNARAHAGVAAAGEALLPSAFLGSVPRVY